MSGIFYFGAPPKGSQVVSSELLSRGINLLRSEPCQVAPHVAPHYANPNYQLYVANLNAAAQAAVKNEYTHIGGSSRYNVGLIPKEVAPFYGDPQIIWSFPSGRTPEQVSSVRDRFNAVETVSQGKPALTATLSVAQVKSLCEDHSPVETTPSSLTAMNIQGFRTYRFLHRVAHFFSFLQQYPLISSTTNTTTTYFQSAFQLLADKATSGVVKPKV